jgi:hypothetical protein
VTQTFSVVADVGSALTAVIAVVIAYWSVQLTNRAMREQETHNRLSVKPIPFLALADYEQRLRAKVTNDGSGPLIIKKIQVRDGKTTKQDLISWMPSPPPTIYWTNFTSLLTDRAMRPGEGLILLQLDGDPEDQAFLRFRDACRHQLEKLTVTVEYTDVYDTVYAPYSRAMDWFARSKGTRS